MARLFALFTLVAISLSVAACGADRTGGPKGAPAEVVGAAADRTLAAGEASFDVSAPDARRSGTIRFASPPEPPAAAGPYPELDDPASVVDLVRGALAVESYGGAAVRGASTFRYELVINVERAVVESPAARRPAMEEFARRLGAAAFYADVWIDADGRLRRVQVPVDKSTERPAARSRALPALVTVDFFGYPT